MRILYSHRIQSRDGQSVHLEEMVAALRAEGHEVLVVGPSLSRYEFGGENALVALIRARLPSFVGVLAEVAYNVPAFWRLHRAARRFRPTLIYERYNLFYLAGVWLARCHRIPLFLEVNAPLAAERERFGGVGLPRLARRLEAYVWRSADRVLAVTSVLKGAVARAGVAPERIEIVPNAINADEFASVPRRESTDQIVLGFIGFVREWHGLDGVISAMAEARDVLSLDLIIVGDGPARLSLEQQAKSSNLGDRVRFTGLQAREQIPVLLGQFDIALQPRAVEYASPLKIFEYMAAGRAIVAPDQPNIREVLRHEETGLLFDPDSPDALWRAIVRLAGDAALRDRLGAAARGAIDRGHYTWAGNARRVVRLASSIP